MDGLKGGNGLTIGWSVPTISFSEAVTHPAVVFIQIYQQVVCNGFGTFRRFSVNSSAKTTQKPCRASICTDSSLPSLFWCTVHRLPASSQSDYQSFFAALPSLFYRCHCSTDLSQGTKSCMCSAKQRKLLTGTGVVSFKMFLTE